MLEHKSEARIDGPELVFPLVAPIGTDVELVTTSLAEALESANYTSQHIRLSELLNEIFGELPSLPEDKRYEKRMDQGNDLRRTTGRSDALGILAIMAIRDERTEVTEEPNKPIQRRAYILRSLKHPGEVRSLRRIYGSGCFVISAYAARGERLQNLARRIADSYHAFHANEYLPQAEFLLRRDEAESDEFGQNVRETFPLGDVFVNVNDPVGLRESINRFVELLLGNQEYTPTRDEFAMFHARAAALRSASLSRQIGAVIATEDGDVIAVGTNEVPKAGGGMYWAGDIPNHRDRSLGYDTSDKMKRSLLADVLNRLRQEGWLAPEKSAKDLDDLVEEALTGAPSPLMRSAEIMNVLAFGRAVHAEMAATIDAARRGVAVKGCVLYTTTFPCHDCARHIVAAGIRKVVYIEPYPKSLVRELHPDSIAVDNPEEALGKVAFEPFVGIGPRLYMDLFEMFGERKGKDGRALAWRSAESLPRLAPDNPSYLIREEEEVARFEKIMEEKKLRQQDKKEA